MARIAIIGAGISGLNCAKYLELNNNLSIDIYEKTDRIGGRIKSDLQDGFILDHGFQVLLKSYPEAMKTFNYQELELYNFKAGASINGKIIGDPLREPNTIIPTIFSDIGSLKDKLLILKLKGQDLKSENLKNVSTKDFLKKFGFSEKIINSFFRPFFSGIFLNNQLENNAHFFNFLFKIFSKDYASIPRNGMEELPKNILSQLRKTKVHLNQEVQIINDQKLKILDSELDYDFIVKAYPSEKDISFYSVTTDYFWSYKDLFKSPRLYLNKDNDININHIAPLTNANPNYSPTGKYLYSVNNLTNTAREVISRELNQIFPNIKFEFLKRYYIKNALPKMKTDLKIKQPLNDLHCGDYLQSPSIDGALKSGRLVAEKILDKVSS
ncbi:MAG: hypothetical protein CME61_01015 [Halobacteriovoraceae bacterium]|nr:hypothetical protein [Halobacteriovoraceae bacterium]